ncbi:hypothetical protein C4579_01825 [Candidatus Microgenomates bacterium]|nr:MAG: hypothetical protein C4579_01825 [Candidatus Microgenomates bacterium]
MKIDQSGWFTSDPSLKLRISKLNKKFNQIFSTQATQIVIAPGRAEILGNHTDYNGGRTLSANIRNNLVVVGSKRTDSKVHLLSFSQTDEKEIFDINHFDKSVNLIWKNYIKGIIREFKSKFGSFDHGFNAIIDSTIPMGGGVSSSAALELAFVHLFEALYGHEIEPIVRVQMAKSAENNYVGSPCGYLDQGTIELSNASWLLIDYQSDVKTNKPFTFSEIQNHLTDITLVIGYDPSTKRQLTEGKYAVRRACCESMVRLWKEVTGKKIKNICDVSYQEFEAQKTKLWDVLNRKITRGLYKDLITNAGWKNGPERQASTMLEWASHPILENERISQAIAAINKKNYLKFGQLFSSSGRSGIYLFDLAEGVHELEWVYNLVEQNKKRWGVFGIRNMGGGFNATTLALVSADKVAHYKKELNNVYHKEFGRDYLFIDFTPLPNVSVFQI